jgi:hypothetical protein
MPASDTKRVTGGPWTWTDYGGAKLIDKLGNPILDPENVPGGIDIADGWAARMGAWKATDAEAEANAQLILTAVNACFSVSPERPQAVAEGIEEMVFELTIISKLMVAADPRLDDGIVLVGDERGTLCVGDVRRVHALLQRMGKIL